MRALGDADPRQAGRYRLLAELGEGGMGRVLLGYGPDGRLVAVKQVRTQFAEDDGFTARFRREVAASRTVSGAYTAAVVDADVDGPTPWLASVFVPGPSLQDAVDVTGVLPEQPALRLAAGLASALIEIHRAGLVHRDLKPSNVLLTADGVRVIDFGIARAVDGESTRVTRTGWLIGSPEYMSPEQAEGHEVTAASDVFSLGSVLVMACTGSSPFSGPSAPRVLYNLVHAEPDLAALPASVRRIAELCLAKDPADRPAPDELLTEIDSVTPSATPWPPDVHRLIEKQQAEVVALLDGGPAEPTVIAPPRVETTTMRIPAPATVSVPPVRRRRWLVPALAAAVVIAAVAGLGVWTPWSPDAPGTTRSPGSSLFWLDGHTDVVNDLAFRPPDGDLLATASNDNTVRLWDLTSRSVVATLRLDNAATDVEFSPDGALLATSGYEPSVRLWDVATRKEVRRLDHGRDVEDLAFSPDGRLLATSTGGTVYLWDTATWQQVPAPDLTKFHHEYASVMFSPDSRLLATTQHEAVRLWDVASGREADGSFVGAPGEALGDPAFSPDGRTLIIPGHDGELILWDVMARKKVAKLPDVGDYIVFQVAISEDGRTVATVGHALQLWDLARRAPLDRPVNDTNGVAFHPDNRTVATGTDEGRVWVYRMPGGTS
jgi:eukaryotic-like serine/threonine-protein kinase